MNIEMPPHERTSITSKQILYGGAVNHEVHLISWLVRASRHILEQDEFKDHSNIRRDMLNGGTDKEQMYSTK
jgi:hypothetical protein